RACPWQSRRVSWSMSPFTSGGGCIERDPDDVEAIFEFVRRLVAEAERASCSVASCGWLVSRECPGLSVPAAAARSSGRVVGGVGSAYTAAVGNWAAASRPVCAAGGVYTGGGHDVVRKEGAQGGDFRSSVTGAGRGWRGVPGAGRVLPAGAAGALLPDA